MAARLVWNSAPSIASGAALLRAARTLRRTFAGVLADGGGTLSLTKADAGTWRLTGANSCRNPSVTGGTLEFDNLANGGIANALGRSSNAAANLLLNNSGLRYVGSSAPSTDRNFTGTTAPRLESNGAGSLTWNGTLTPTNALTFTLGGANTGNSLFASALTDFNTAGAAYRAIKSPAGAWALSGLNILGTRIDAGLLRLDSSAALSGGLAVTGRLRVVCSLQRRHARPDRGQRGLHFAVSGAVPQQCPLAGQWWFRGFRRRSQRQPWRRRRCGRGAREPSCRPEQSHEPRLLNADSTIDHRNHVGLGNTGPRRATNDGSAASMRSEWRVVRRRRWIDEDRRRQVGADQRKYLHGRRRSAPAYCRSVPAVRREHSAW
jgi:hypothetical protein